jgi:hypothetical protein
LTVAHSIYLNNNNLTDKGAILLGANLNDLPNFSFIDLQFNFIDLSGADAIFKLKLTHPNLTIALHGNKITNVADMYEIEKKYLDREKNQTVSLKPNDHF